LEQKELIVRERSESDRRVVKAHITEKGRQVSIEKRTEIHNNYKGLFKILGEQDVRELIRLLKIMDFFIVIPPTPLYGENEGNIRVI
ncbi:MAG: hypothetical protein IIU49_06495, partial [Spirochaetales bacterium]|nr:hypothetical protein [Spirochaetales bacterium]